MYFFEYGHTPFVYNFKNAGVQHYVLPSFFWCATGPKNISSTYVNFIIYNIVAAV